MKKASPASKAKAPVQQPLPLPEPAPSFPWWGHFPS